MDTNLAVQADVASRIVRCIHVALKEVKPNETAAHAFTFRDVVFWFSQRNVLMMHVGGAAWSLTTSGAAKEDASVEGLYDKIVPNRLNDFLLKQSKEFFATPKKD